MCRRRETGEHCWSVDDVVLVAILRLHISVRDLNLSQTLLNEGMARC